MTSKKSVNVGIIGFGTVGTGTARILIDNADIIRRRLGAPVILKKISDLDITKDRGIKLGEVKLTTDAKDIISDPDIDVVVELIGGYKPAKEFILEAMENKKHVVTANKALLAVHGEELYAAATKYGVTIGFEASVAGGIPILAAVRNGLAANNIKSIYGIVNGTCNYILTLMTNAGRKFDEVLREAQAKGYAEADPTFDIEGIDSAHKLAVLTMLAYGTPVKFNDIYTEGISKITPLDIDFAKELGYKIKLLAITKMVNGEVEARVHPTMLPEEYPIATVDGVFNALSVVGDAVGQTMFYGRGAGDMPTGSAVVSDVIDIGRDILAGSSNRSPVAAFRDRRELAIRKMDDITSCYYLRFAAMDKPGVLSRISGVLGKNNISISSVIQKGRGAAEAVPLVMMSHEAVERDVRRALDEINKMDCVAGQTMVIRVEEGGRG
ncbi:MAG TPA: homoserine dehydrogenase [Nitrospirota bacterium]|nr:homoserine dehydrogenase [Nitrospirota bacterium]